jgi:hypothetical protein
VTAWLGAFALTQLVEVPIYLRVFPGRPLVCIGASLLTHPIVFFVFPALWPGSYWAQVAAAEAFAVGAEAAYLSALGVSRSVWWALAANAASVGVGLTSRWLWGWP